MKQVGEVFVEIDKKVTVHEDQEVVLVGEKEPTIPIPTSPFQSESRRESRGTWTRPSFFG